MMKPEDLSWEINARRIEDFQGAFPELDGITDALISDLRSVRRIYGEARIPDRRLFQIDLSNLAFGLARIASLRAEAVDEDKISQAITDMCALATDMRTRSQVLIDDMISDTLMHTSVATLGLKNEMAPQKRASAHPMRLREDDTQEAYARDRTHTAVILDTEGVGGKMAGEVATAQIVDPCHSAHVHQNIFFLPEGRILTVGEGEAVALWEGQPDQSIAEVLENAAYRIEATSGMIEIQGPVFISKVASGMRVLDGMNGLTLMPKAHTPMSPIVSIFRIAAGFTMVQMMMMISWAMETTPDPQSLPAWLTTAVPLTAAYFVITGFNRVKMFKDGHTSREKKLHKLTRVIWNLRVRKRAKINGLLPNAALPAALHTPHSQPFSLLDPAERVQIL